MKPMPYDLSPLPSHPWGERVEEGHRALVSLVCWLVGLKTSKSSAKPMNMLKTDENRWFSLV